jgi:hypothetical protein
MAGRFHEHLLDRDGRLIVRVGVPADVLAGGLVAVADAGERVEDAAASRDVVAEVVPLDHVLAPPARDRGQGRVNLESPQPGACAGAVGQCDEFGFGRRIERVAIPGQGSDGGGQGGGGGEPEQDGDRERGPT